MVNLYPHQEEVLRKTRNFKRVAYYLDMGLGKTFVGSEKANSFKEKIVVVCQKSKLQDWMEHFQNNYDLEVFNLRKTTALPPKKCVGVINYDLLYRREFAFSDFTLLLDESGMIQNENAKRTKYILKLKPTNVILLSGTPTSGKYEKLYSQLKLLGWDISKKDFYKEYIITKSISVGNFSIPVVVGYKNVDKLKQILKEHGAVFMKSEDVINLPMANTIVMNDLPPKGYKSFMQTGIARIDGRDLIADTPLSKRLYARMILGAYNKNRYQTLLDMINSTEDRLIIFYNFNEELKELQSLIDRPLSVVNGKVKDLSAYENEDNSVTLIQYQAGAMGLNLQKANKIIYFSLPEKSDLFEQSKKRVHRIGQASNCFYYIMLAKGSIEERILDCLNKRRDYNEYLFK